VKLNHLAIHRSRSVCANFWNAEAGHRAGGLISIELLFKLLLSAAFSKVAGRKLVVAGFHRHAEIFF
jgi:hypothetical protein